MSFAISRVDTVRQSYAGLQGTVAPTLIFGRSPTQDAEPFWRPFPWYLGDVSYFDAVIVEADDGILPRIERALGEPARQSDASPDGPRNDRSGPPGARPFAVALRLETGD